MLLIHTLWGRLLYFLLNTLVVANQLTTDNEYFQLTTDDDIPVYLDTDVTLLTNKVQQLEQKCDDLIEQTNSLNAINTQLEDEIQDLESSVISSQTKIQQLKSKRSELEEEIQNLHSAWSDRFHDAINGSSIAQMIQSAMVQYNYDDNVDELHNKITDFELTILEHITKMKSDIEDLKYEDKLFTDRSFINLQVIKAIIDSLGTEFHSTANELVSTHSVEMNEEIKEITQAVPAFSAYYDGVRLFPAYAETIPFQAVIVNNGNAYNSDTSVFTCPVLGTYFFSVTVFTGFLQLNHRYYKSMTALLLLKDKIIYAKIHILTTDTEDFFQYQGATSVMIVCAAGSKVSVVSGADWNAVQIEGYANVPRTIFSGFLVNKL